MKKFIALILVSVMCIGLMACSKPAEEVTEEPAEETTEETEEAVTEEPAEEETEETTAPAAGSVDRIIVFNNAIEGLEASPQPRSDEMREAYSIKEVYDKFETKGSDPVKVIGSDGYEAEEALDDILKKYFTLEGDAAPIIVGEEQDPDWAVWEVAYINFGSDVWMTAYKDEISVADVFTAVGMTTAESYDFICTDGYTQNVPATDIADCYITWVEDRVDASVPGLGDDTLWSIVTIQPAQ
ncbi:MAG: hypothetical protein LBQ95_02320 [Lachnospiraceae bacterium]|jgi:hypothetical protein|nr:hypothetical protein [Lachnospiraceae bacterium]